MSHAQHWPELNSAPSRLKIFLIVLFGVACVSFATLMWRDTVSRALLRNSSPAPESPAHFKLIPPALASTNSTVEKEDGLREAEFLVFMADEMFVRGDIAGATHAFEKAVEQNPTSEKNQLKLALCYIRLQREDEALAALGEAIHIAPDYAEAHHQLGLLHMKSGRLTEAAEHLVELTRLKPQQPNGFNALGLAYARQRNFPSAATNFLAALRLNPRYPEAHFNLSQVYLQLGAMKQAAAELDIALQINPRFEAARKARAQLAQSNAR